MHDAALDQPLPMEIAGTGHGWLTAYRRWPAFSPAWARGRLRWTGTWLAGVLGMVALSMAGQRLPGDPFPWPTLVNLTVQLVLPAVLGPWLASRVRRLGLSRPRELAALVGVMALMVALVVGYRTLASDPMRQLVAAATGQLDAQGRAPRVAVMIGITVGQDPRSVAPGLRDEPPLAPPVAGHVIAGVVTLLLAGAVGLLRWQREGRMLVELQRRRELERAQTERREAEMRLSVLQAQVEPHFLFNTLAGVRSAITTDPARASAMVDRLVDYLRAAIPRLRDGRAEATVGAQFELVRAYLGLMAARMPRLAFAVDCPPALVEAHCPPLMLVSLVENAVRHGIEPKVGPARIAVSARAAEDGRLAIAVEDDGVGFGGDTAGTGLGLANIRARLAQLYAGQGDLRLQVRPGGGVAATLLIPLETPAAAGEAASR